MLEAEPGSGRVKIAFEGKREFLNPMGNIQGGFVAAMLDDTMGPALGTTFAPDEFGPTIELKVNFLKPTKPGRLIAEARVVQRGRSIAFLAGEIFDEAGNLLATATATAKIVKVGRDGFVGFGK